MVDDVDLDWVFVWVLFCIDEVLVGVGVMISIEGVD